MKISFRPIIGAFRLVGKRAIETERPGLAMWAAEGERAAVAVCAHVRDGAHAAEVCTLEAAKEIEAGLAGLADGRVDAEDLAHFRRAARLEQRAAEHAHELGEVAT